MRRAVTGIKLVFCLALLSAGPAFTQSPSDEEISKAAAAAAPVAHVYVQTNNGVNVYDAAANGKLTLVKGSPFATNGYMQGVNGKYLISVGYYDTNLYSYRIEPDGGVGPVVSQVDTLDYGGSECGYFDPGSWDAVLDHTGKYFYLQLDSNSGPLCAGFQSYMVGSNGQLTFLGDFVSDQESGSLTVSSNDNFVYASTSPLVDGGFSAYTRTSAGDIVPNSSFSVTGPVSDPSNGWSYYLTGGPKADPASHLGAVVFASPNPLGPIDGAWQMASYTINPATGAITSTNTWKNMPVLHESSFADLRMSPSGKILVVLGDGLDLFHFNGAAPMTPFKSMLPNVFFQQAGWDNENHLYALTSVENTGRGDYYDGGIYAYTVTPTGVSAVPGSPFKVANLIGWDRMFVVPKL